MQEQGTIRMSKVLKSCFIKGIIAGALIAALFLAAQHAFAQDHIPAAAQAAIDAAAGSPADAALQAAEEPGTFLKMAVGLLLKFNPDLRIKFIQAGMWLGAIASLLTGLSIFLQSAAVALSKVFQWGGLMAAKEAIDRWNAWLQPKIRYLSVFNVQKS